MLNRASLERKEFKEEELAPIKKLDLNDLKVPMPKNLDQLLIWTSNLLNIIMLNSLTKPNS